MTTYYVDPRNGSDAADGLGWGTAWKTLTNGATSARLGTTDSDEIRIAKSPDPISIGSVTWTHGQMNSEITVPSGSNITLPPAVWTAGLITPTYPTTTYRWGNTGAGSTQVVLAATNGRVCYRTLTSTNFSAHTRITFWVNFSAAANYTAGCPVQIRLCSDTTGTTAVNTLTLPSYYYPANYWVPIVIDNVSGLGAAIQSVAIYTSSAVTATVRFDNFSFAKPVSDPTAVVLTDLIAKDNGKGEYFPIAYINNAIVSLIQPSPSVAAPGNIGTTNNPHARYYSINGTETVNTLRRECFSTAITVPATATTTSILTINYTASANAGSKTYAGGYNTATDTIDGETWFDGVTGYGYGLTPNTTTAAKWSVDRISVARYQVGLKCWMGDQSSITKFNMVNNVKTYEIALHDALTGRQYLVSPLVIESPWTYTGVGAVIMGVSTANNANWVFDMLPEWWPTITATNIYDRAAIPALSSPMPYIFNVTDTLISNCANGNVIIDVPPRGKTTVNNCLLMPNTASVFQTYNVFGFGAQTYNSQACYGAPVRLVDLTGEVRPAEPGVIAASSSTFCLAYTSVNGNSTMIIKGTTPNSSYNSDGLQSWLTMASPNLGNFIFDSIKSNAAMPEGFNSGGNGFGGQVSLKNYNQDPTKNRLLTFIQNHSGITSPKQYWETQTAVTYTGSSAWRKYYVQELGYGYYSANDHIIAGIATVKGGTPVTVTMRVRRTSLNAVGYLAVYGGYAGIPDAGVVAKTTGAINDWELLTITFTPTENAVVPIRMGNTAVGLVVGQSVYFDDLQISQA